MMKILLLHLSDIHFTDEYNVVFSRAEKIVSAVQSVEPEVKDFFVTVTGDVAYGGEESQYKIANDFLDDINIGLLQSRPNARVEEILIPGNHDCKLKPENKLRTLAINAILEKVRAPYSGEPEYINPCLGAQDNFFKFRSYRDGTPLLEGLSRLFYQNRFNLGDFTIRFDCYNSAWLSRNPEQQGKLLIPTNLGKETDFSSESGAVISVFHHPYGWLNSNNARAFTHQVEERSDIIMTGHEHVGDQYQKRDMRGPIQEYFSGEVLQEGDEPQSGFYIIVLDLERKLRKIWNFKWDKEIYSPTNVSEWCHFERKADEQKAGLRISDEFDNFLNDAGVTFLHPRKGPLSLKDIYIHPNFDEISYEKSRSTDFFLREKPGEKLIDYILQEKSVLFLGEDRSGKTSLAKNVYSELYEKGYFPVFMDGKDIKSHLIESIISSIDSSVKIQYNAEKTDKFHQVLLEKKVIVIDNFHLMPLSPKGKNKVLEHLKILSSIQIIIASDIVQLKSLLRQEGQENVLFGFKHCNIREFSLRMRGRLIEKWFALGREFTGEEKQIALDVINAEKTISTILGKNVIPSLPFFILTLLQVSDWDSSKDAAYGAHGYYYEALITKTLQESSDLVHVDILYPLTSRIAYFMHNDQQRWIDDKQFLAICKEYEENYEVNLNESSVRTALVESRIMKSDGDGNLGFHYSHLKNYFTARFIKDSLNGDDEGEVREKISGLISKLYVEENTGILIFLVYLVKDARIIKEMVLKAKGIFSDHSPIDLEKDVDFADRFNKMSGFQPLELQDSCETDKRTMYREELERISKIEDESQYDSERDVEDRELDAIMQLNVAFKTLQILGQILRNFPGTLKGRDKIEITQECFLLGLRTMRVVFGVTEADIENVRSYLGQIFQEQYQLPCETSLERKELDLKVDAFCFQVLWTTAQLFIKRISTAVGAEHLTKVYSAIPSGPSPLAIDLINVAIKLDHFKSFPENDVMSVWDRVEKRPFTRNIIRSMVYDRLRLFPCTVDMRKRICAELDIKSNDSKIIIGSQATNVKRLK